MATPTTIKKKNVSSKNTNIKSKPPKKKSGGGLFYLFLIILLGGGGYYLYQEKLARDRAAAEAEALAKKAVPAEVVKEIEPTDDYVITPIDDDSGGDKVAVVDEPLPDEFAATIAEAEAMMKKYNWSGAEAKYRAATKMPAPENALKRANIALSAAGLFADTEAKIKPSIESNAQDLFLVTLRDGSKFMGKYDQTQSKNDTLVFLKDGGVTQFIKKKEITKQEEIDQATLDKQIMENLDGRRKIAKSDVEWFFCGEKALTFSKKNIAGECFLAALAQSDEIAINVAEQRAARLFALAAMEKRLKKKSAERKFTELQKTYGHTKVAKNAVATLQAADELEAEMARQKEEMKAQAKAKKTEEIAEKKRSSNEDLAAIEDDIAEARKEIGDEPVTKETANKGDELRKKGEELVSEAQNSPNRAGANEAYKKALKNFREAAAVYQSMLDKKYDDKISEKLDECTKTIYWCRKLQTL